MRRHLSKAEVESEITRVNAEMARRDISPYKRKDLWKYHGRLLSMRAKYERDALIDELLEILNTQATAATPTKGE